ncbi:NAD-dependent epimerase/dehydratase family protein [Halovenus rubra]|uniref:NAD-dependent epimerase/dehydratase family protein n=2 Tax=Halovenus rubra TaxID=869890 RepID=A0ABD5X2C6_9EURY|nr:NAD(P)-dependent oxidoreductase [Halovenus rubra]
MDALVTGHAGYIGGVLADQLVENGHNVIGFDRTADAGDDIRDRDRVEEVITTKELDIVYHLAADADVWVDDWPYLLENNVVGTANVAAATAEADIPLVFASSVAASGEFNRYGRSKNLAEQAVSEYDNVTTVRFPNVAGRGAPRGQAQDMIQEALSGDIEVWDNGNIRRSYIDVRDLASALIDIGTNAYTVRTPSSIFAHTVTNLELGESIQTVVAEETDTEPTLSLVDRTPPSPRTLTAAEWCLQNPIPLKESLRSQVQAALNDTGSA